MLISSMSGISSLLSIVVVWLDIFYVFMRIMIYKQNFKRNNLLLCFMEILVEYSLCWQFVGFVTREETKFSVEAAVVLLLAYLLLISYPLLIESKFSLFPFLCCCFSSHFLVQNLSHFSRLCSPTMALWYLTICLWLNILKSSKFCSSIIRM